MDGTEFSQKFTPVAQIHVFIHSFIHSIGMCRMRFLAVPRSFFHPPSLHLAIHFLLYLSVLFFPNSFGNSISIAHIVQEIPIFYGWDGRSV
jgi:hypothetical protein